MYTVSYFSYPISECSSIERDFIFCLSSYRVHIEQASGQLEARWSCLKKILRFDLRKTVRIIKVRMKLHNFCLDPNDVDFTSHMSPQDKHEIREEANNWVCAFHRTENTTTETVEQVNANKFTSTGRNELREMVRRSNKGRYNITATIQSTPHASSNA